jgi:hypothetical protein
MEEKLNEMNQKNREMNNRTSPLCLVWLTRILLLMTAVFFLTGCGSFNAEAGYYVVKVNPDLSGEVSMTLFMTPGQYNDIGWYYGDFVTTDSRLAYDIAQQLGWENYTWDKRVEMGRHVMVVTAPFANPRQYATELLDTLSPNDMPQGSGGAADSVPSGIHQVDGLFNRTYSMSNILPGERNARFPVYYLVSLPGSVVATDGDVEQQVVMWARPTQPQYFYVVSAALHQYDVRFDIDFSEADEAVLAVTVLATRADLDRAAGVYGGDAAANANQTLANVWARNLGLIDYELSTQVEGGRTALTLTSVYASRQELVGHLNTIPLFEDMAVKVGSSFLSNDLILSGTLAPLDEQYGRPNSVTLTVNMPGPILADELNDEAPPETNAQSYVWTNEPLAFTLNSDQDGVSPAVVFIGIGGALLTLLCAGLVGLLAVVYIIRRRSAAEKKI